MTRTIQRSAIILAAVGLIVGLSSVAAAGRTAVKTAPRVAALARPPVIDSGHRAARFSPSFAEASGTTNRQSNDGSAGMPAGTESVIGEDGRVQVTDTQSYPASAIGQIELTQHGLALICTGWLIDPNTILTSGHCAYDPSPAGTDIIESAIFAPGRNGAVDAFGTCDVVSAYSPAGWRIDGKAASDWALMQLGTFVAGAEEGFMDCPIGDTVGWLGYFWKPGADALKGMKVRVEGYPGDKPPGTQWKMNGMISTSDKNMAYYKMDTFGGQSGSPIFVPNRSGCGPCGAAIHSYGFGPGAPSATKNSGPRITRSKFLLIQNLADNNDSTA